MASQFSKEIDKQIEIDELRAELKKQGESLNVNEDIRNIQSTVKSALAEAEEYEPLPREEQDKLYVAPSQETEQAESKK